jgi:hypothetical protein
MRSKDPSKSALAFFFFFFLADGGGESIGKGPRPRQATSIVSLLLSKCSVPLLVFMEAAPRDRGGWGQLDQP